MNERHTHASGVETWTSADGALCLCCPKCNLVTVHYLRYYGKPQCWYCHTVYKLDSPLSAPREPQTKPPELGEEILRDALARSPYDVGQCAVCGLAVVCLPDGLPICKDCSEKEAGR